MNHIMFIPHIFKCHPEGTSSGVSGGQKIAPRIAKRPSSSTKKEAKSHSCEPLPLPASSRILCLSCLFFVRKKESEGSVWRVQK